MIRLALGNGHRQHDADRSHQHRSNHKHGAPAEMVGDHAGYRPCQQNPQQQTAHDSSDHAAARLFRRQVCGQWNQDLHRDGTEAHQQRNQQEHIGLISERRAQQAGNRHQRGGDHQPTVFQQIAQRHQEEQA
ncbi:hypothetical protein D3C71_1700430 [compost metagenome]